MVKPLMEKGTNGGEFEEYVLVLDLRSSSY